MCGGHLGWRHATLLRVATWNRRGVHALSLKLFCGVHHVRVAAAVLPAMAFSSLACACALPLRRALLFTYRLAAACRYLSLAGWRCSLMTSRCAARRASARNMRARFYTFKYMNNLRCCRLKQSCWRGGRRHDA